MAGILLTDPAEVTAALENPSLVPPGPPGALAGATMDLRAAMARFSGPDVHAARRAAVVAAIETVDATRLGEIAAARTAARLTLNRVDVLAALAGVVPTEALATCLGVDGPLDELVADVDAIVAVIGRGASATPASDAAVERLSARFAGHPTGVVPVLSLLYQNFDATAALIATRLAATVTGDEAPAVPRTKRVAPGGTEIIIEIGAAGLPFGAGAHRCPGESLAAAIVEAVVSTVADAGYIVDPASLTTDVDGRPTALVLDHG